MAAMIMWILTRRPKRWQAAVPVESVRHGDHHATCWSHATTGGGDFERDRATYRLTPIDKRVILTRGSPDDLGTVLDRVQSGPRTVRGGISAPGA